MSAFPRLREARRHSESVAKGQNRNYAPQQNVANQSLRGSDSQNLALKLARLRLRFFGGGDMRIFVAIGGLLAITNLAWGADMAVKAPPMAPVVTPAYNWTSFYVGLNGGYGFGNSTWTAVGVPGGLVATTDGVLVGGTIGANFQTNALVFGIEADLDYSTVKGDSAPICSFPPTLACQTSNDWLGTARGRIGFAADRVLLFGTGGIAVGDVQATLAGHIPAITNSVTVGGWTAGGGAEVAFAQNWRAKVEYLYVDLLNGECISACGAGTGGNVVAVKFTESLVRLGVNYKF